MTCVRPYIAVWFKPDVPVDLRQAIALDRPFIVHGGSDHHDTNFVPEFWLRYVARRVRAYRPYVPEKVFDLIHLPCGRCEACLMDRAREWTARCLFEAEYHTQACFITLTCDDDHMSDTFPNGVLDHRPWQLFAKSLRQQVGSFRFLMCGEYGTESHRPHYHALIYGYEPDDLVVYHPFPQPLYISETLSRLWNRGFVTVGELSMQSIQYVCRYVMKKCGGGSGEYIRMSLRPAIGYRYFCDHWQDIFSHGADLTYYNDYVYCGQSKIKVPRFFDKKYREIVPDSEYQSLKIDRARRASTLKRVTECDLKRAEEYIKVISKGRVVSGERNV